MTPPHQTAPMVLGCTSSTMATRFAATRVPLATRRSGELRPCKLAPARLRSRAIHSVTGPSPMRKLSADANRQTVPISPVRKASESDARHNSSRRLMLESAAFTLAMSARHAPPRLESAAFSAGPTGPSLSGQRIEATAAVSQQTIRSTNNQVRGLRKGSVHFWSILKGLYGGLHFSLVLLLLSA